MKGISIILKKGLDKLRNSFYKNTFEFLIFLIAIILLKIFQVEYRIKNFSFPVSIGLLLTGYFIYIFLVSKKIKNKLRHNLLILAAVILAAIILTNQKEVLNLLSNMRENYRNIQQAFYYSKDTYFYQHLPYLILILPALMVMALLLESKGLGVIVLGGCLIYLSLLWYSAELWNVRGYVLVFIITGSFAYCIEGYKSAKRSCEKGDIKVSIDIKKIVGYALVLSIVVGAISYTAVKITGTKSVAKVISDKLENSKLLIEKGKIARFDLSTSGYSSSSSKLGGPVKLSYDTAFKVSAEEPLYLRAVAKDFYDGHKWTKTDSVYSRKDKDKIKQTSGRYLQYFQAVPNDSVSTKSFTVYPNLLGTSTIFNPNYTADISLKKGYAGYNSDGDYILLGKDTITDPYRVIYYQSSLGFDKFSNIYNNNINIPYSAGDMAITEKYNKYLQLPDNISKEIYDLAKSITKDSKSTTETIYNIQTYLSKNYKYSLNVSEVPDNKEFVDYFLFSERKGYCTYFATSAAVLCRLSGIPARYVEGFSMGDKKDSEGLYDVTNDMAHAWVEVLVNPELDVWSIVDSVPEAEKEPYVDNGSQNISRYPSGTGSATEGAGSQSGDNTNTKSKKIILYSLGISGGIFAVFVMILLIRAVLFELNNRKLLKAESVIPLYYHTRHRLALVQGRISEDDLVWLEQTDDSELKEVLQYLVDGAYSEFYGKKTKLELDRKKILNTSEVYLKQKQGKLKYLLFKCLTPIK